MNKREQSAVVKAQEKAQKEYADRCFKEKARFEALSTAKFLNTEEKGVVITRMTDTKVIGAAEKIYQWLIKVLK